MTAPPGDHPFPHPELRYQKPLIFTLGKGEALYRHHHRIHDPVFFGMTGMYRFDDPDFAPGGSFGVLYAGADPKCCLLESCGSTPGLPVVYDAYLNARQIARLKTNEDLRFVDLVAPGGLTSIGADGRLTTGLYRVAQRWSAALRNHPTRPDGIRYRSRHAPELIAYAIFTRSPATFSVSSMGPFKDAANEDLFKSILKTYNFAFI